MKAILFRVYLILTILSVVGIRLASPLWIEESSQIKEQRALAYREDVEKRLIYIASGVTDATSLIEYAYYDPMLIYDETWQRMLIHTTLSVQQANDYLLLLPAPESEQEYRQNVLGVSSVCAEYTEHLLDAMLTYGYENSEGFLDSMEKAQNAYFDCREQFNDLAEKYDLFQESSDMNST